MSASNTEPPGGAGRLAAGIRKGAPVSADVPLAVFRDVYHQLAGGNADERLTWAIIFLGDQVVAQPIGRPEVLLTLQEKKARYYSRTDFDFVPSARAVFYGSADGRYRFRTFLRDIFGYKRLALMGFATALLAIAAFLFLPREVNQKLDDALISALAIFISIFVLFVLAVDPEQEFRYILSDRYRKLAQSDKYIALVGLSALVIAIAGAALAAAPVPDGQTFLRFGEFLSIPKAHVLRAGQSLATAISVVLTYASFWLVVAYHFSRRHEMTEIRMTKTLLEQLHRRYQPAVSLDGAHRGRVDGDGEPRA